MWRMVGDFPRIFAHFPNSAECFRGYCCFRPPSGGRCPTERTNITLSPPTHDPRCPTPRPLLRRPPRCPAPASRHRSATPAPPRSEPASRHLAPTPVPSPPPPRPALAQSLPDDGSTRGLSPAHTKKRQPGGSTDPPCCRRAIKLVLNLCNGLFTSAPTAQGATPPLRLRTCRARKITATPHYETSALGAQRSAQIGIVGDQVRNGCFFPGNILHPGASARSGGGSFPPSGSISRCSSASAWVLPSGFRPRCGGLGLRSPGEAPRFQRRTSEGTLQWRAQRTTCSQGTGRYRPRGSRAQVPRVRLHAGELRRRDAAAVRRGLQKSVRSVHPLAAERFRFLRERAALVPRGPRFLLCVVRVARTHQPLWLRCMCGRYRSLVTQRNDRPDQFHGGSWLAMLLLVTAGSPQSIPTPRESMGEPRDPGVQVVPRAASSAVVSPQYRYLGGFFLCLFHHPTFEG